MLVHCPACDKKLQVGAEALGKKIRCPHCKEVFRASADETPDEHAEAVEVAPPTPRGRREPPPLREAPPPRRRRDDEDDHDRDDQDRDDLEEDHNDRRDRRRGRGRRDRDDRDDERDRDDDRDRDDADRGRRGMPGSVMVAVSALGVMVALQLGLGLLVLVFASMSGGPLARLLVQMAFSVIIGGLILWGLIAGHRLAWQWGRVLGVLGAVLMLLAGVAAFAGGNVLLAIVGAIYLFVSGCLFTIFFSLGAKTAKKFFRLRCPECGRFTSSAADFFFNRAKCKSCGEIW